MVSYKENERLISEEREKEKKNNKKKTDLESMGMGS